MLLYNASEVSCKSVSNHFQNQLRREAKKKHLVRFYDRQNQGGTFFDTNQAPKDVILIKSDNTWGEISQSLQKDTDNQQKIYCKIVGFRAGLIEKCNRIIFVAIEQNSRKIRVWVPSRKNLLVF